LAERHAPRNSAQARNRQLADAQSARDVFRRAAAGARRQVDDDPRTGLRGPLPQLVVAAAIPETATHCASG
jgi:hypothetical protein